MKVAFFSTTSYDKQFFDSANVSQQHQLIYLDARLTPESAICAVNCTAVCCFVNDQLDAKVLQQLAKEGVKLIALRSAGFNHVDVVAAQQLGLTVMRVPAYSPYAVAEFTLALILMLNRKILHAYARIKEQNFALRGLLGFDLHGKTVGIIGTGKIGSVFAHIMQGMGCHLLANDIQCNTDCEKIGVKYVSLDELLASSDIISLHCPLTPQTHHLINHAAIAKMKNSVMLINTSRGAVIDTHAVIDGLKTKKIGYLGLDVYEEEEALFFKDLSDTIIQDDVFARLQTFPNVIITGHQAFFTQEAMQNIATTTIANLTHFEQGTATENLIT